MKGKSPHSITIFQNQIETNTHVLVIHYTRHWRCAKLAVILWQSSG